MSILALVIVLALLGLLVWGAYKLPIPNGFKMLIYVVVVLVAILLCLEAFGLLDTIRGVQVPRIN